MEEAAFPPRPWFLEGWRRRRALQVAQRHVRCGPQHCGGPRPTHGPSLLPSLQASARQTPRHLPPRAARALNAGPGPAAPTATSGVTQWPPGPEQVGDAARGPCLPPGRGQAAGDRERRGGGGDGRQAGAHTRGSEPQGHWARHQGGTRCPSSMGGLRGHPALPSTPRPGRRDLPQEALQDLSARAPPQERRAAHGAGGRTAAWRPGLTPPWGRRLWLLLQRLLPAGPAPPALGPSPLLSLPPTPACSASTCAWLAGLRLGHQLLVPSVCGSVTLHPSVCPGPSGPWGSPGWAAHWLPRAPRIALSRSLAGSRAPGPAPAPGRPAAASRWSPAAPFSARLGLVHPHPPAPSETSKNVGGKPSARQPGA